MGDGGTWGGAGGTWMWLLTWLVVLLVVGVGYLPYAAVRRSADRASDPVLEELRVAYARGDRSDEEFERWRERLRREE